MQDANLAMKPRLKLELALNTSHRRLFLLYLRYKISYRRIYNKVTDFCV